MRHTKLSFLAGFLAFLALALGSGGAFAQTAAAVDAVSAEIFRAGLLDSLLLKAGTFTARFAENMRVIGMTLFGALAAMELATSAIELVHEGGADLEKFFYGLWKKVFTLLVFWALLTAKVFPVPELYKNVSATTANVAGVEADNRTYFLPWLAYGIMSLGAQAAFQNPQLVTPSGLIDKGTQIISSHYQALSKADQIELRDKDGSPYGTDKDVGIIDGIRMWVAFHLMWLVAWVTNMFTALVLGGAMLVLALNLFATMVEMAVAAGIGALFLAGGASRWTREYAMKAINYAVSAGAKGIVVFALAGIVASAGQEFSADLTAAIDQTIALHSPGGEAQNALPIVGGMIIGTLIGGVLTYFTVTSDNPLYNPLLLQSVSNIAAMGGIGAVIGLILIGLSVKVQSLAGAFISGATASTFGSIVSGAASALRTPLAAANPVVGAAAGGAGALGRAGTGAAGSAWEGALAAKSAIAGRMERSGTSTTPTPNSPPPVGPSGGSAKAAGADDGRALQTPEAPSGKGSGEGGASSSGSDRAGQAGVAGYDLSKQASAANGSAGGADIAAAAATRLAAQGQAQKKVAELGQTSGESTRMAGYAGSGAVTPAPATPAAPVGSGSAAGQLDGSPSTGAPRALASADFDRAGAGGPGSSSAFDLGKKAAAGGSSATQGGSAGLTGAGAGPSAGLASADTTLASKAAGGTDTGRISGARTKDPAATRNAPPAPGRTSDSTGGESRLAKASLVEGRAPGSESAPTAPAGAKAGAPRGVIQASVDFLDGVGQGATTVDGNEQMVGGGNSFGMKV